jgi:hypothetical protein
VVSLDATQSQGQSLYRSSLAAPVAGQSAARETSGTQSDSASQQLSTTGQWSLARGDTLQLRINLSEQASSARPLAGSSEAALRSSSDSEARTHEVAGEWQAPLQGNASLALTALYTRAHSSGQSRLDVAGTQSASGSQSSTGESALRAELRGRVSPHLSYTTGADYAVNFLQGDFTYSVNDLPIDVPGSASEVSEQRSGVFGSASWTPTPTWTSEASLRWERSVLHNRSGATERYTFGDWIPRLTGAWTPRPGHKVQANVERVVGQLAFSQFLAAVQLQDQIITAGADTLQPERSWTYGLDYEYRFGERGLLSAGAARVHIDNPIDAVPVDELSEIATNVNAATLDTLTLDFTTPLDNVGLTGGLLTAHLGQTLSRTRDPITDQSRAVSGASPALSASVSLRQNLPKGAWGVSGRNASASTFYGVRQISQLRQRSSLSLFGEWRPLQSLAARLTLAAPSRSTSTSVLYAAPRTPTQAPSVIYLSTTQQDPTWQAKLEWEPRNQALLELALTPRAETAIVGETFSGPSSTPTDIQRTTVASDTTVSAQLKLRW